MRNCEDAQALISAMLDGELSEADAVGLRAHIAECADCRAMYQAFAAVSAAVTAEEPLPGDLHNNIMSTVRAAEQAMRKQKKLTRLRTVLSLAACLVVVVGTVFSLRSTLPGFRSANANNSDAMSARTSGARNDFTAMMNDEARSGEMIEGDLSVPGAEKPQNYDFAANDIPMPAAEPKEPLPEYGGAAEGEAQLLTLELTELADDRIVGTVTACSGDVFAEGQEITVILEEADTALDSAAADGTTVEVEFDRWEDGVVYARSVRTAE